jgi:hypothetical protein
VGVIVVGATLLGFAIMVPSVMVVDAHRCNVIAFWMTTQSRSNQTFGYEVEKEHEGVASKRLRIKFRFNSTNLTCYKPQLLTRLRKHF